MNDMKTTTRSAVPTGNGLMLPRLAPVQQTPAPVDKSAKWSSSNLIQWQLNFSYAGVCYRELVL